MQASSLFHFCKDQLIGIDLRQLNSFRL